MNIKRIAIVLPNLSIIGAQRVAIEYGTRLIQHGYDIDWVCGGTGEWEKELEKDKIKLFNARWLYKIRGVRILEQIVRLAIITHKKKYDVVLSVTPFYNRILCYLKKIKLLKSRLVIEDHAYPPRSYPDEFPNNVVRSMYLRTEKIYDQADIVRTLTNDSKVYYEKSKNNNNIVAQPNLMNISRVEKASEIEIKAISSSLPELVYIGRFTTQKNIVFLLECAAELVKKINFKLTIIGYGPQEELLHKKTSELNLQNIVSFVQSSDENYAILKRATLFPFVSIWEGFPLVLIESMIVETAIVSVDCRTGPREIIGENSERGWLTPENNKKAFINAIEEAINNKEMRERKTLAAKKYVLEELNIEKNFVKYIKIFIEGQTEFQNGN